MSLYARPCVYYMEYMSTFCVGGVHVYEYVNVYEYVYEHICSLKIPLRIYFHFEKYFVFLAKDRILKLQKHLILYHFWGDSSRTRHSISFVSSFFQLLGSVGSLAPKYKSLFVFLLRCLPLLTFNYHFPLMTLI